MKMPFHKILFSLIIFGVISGHAFAQHDFLSSAEIRSKKSKFKKVCDRTDVVSAKVLKEYGAMFVAGDSVTIPTKCVFENEDQVTKFQGALELSTVNIAGTKITLQKGAMTALLDAINAAKDKGISITPRGGSIAGLRNYGDTLRLWNSRFYPALDHWTARGKISKDDSKAARAFAAHEQVPKVLEWEKQSIWFSTNFDRSILSSVAAPGTSQHLSGLALDVSQFADARVRAILREFWWFQTVEDDTPHFTYLGRPEEELENFGLISKSKNGYKFWVPAIPVALR